MFAYGFWGNMNYEPSLCSRKYFVSNRKINKHVRPISPVYYLPRFTASDGCILSLDKKRCFIMYSCENRYFSIVSKHVNPRNISQPNPICELAIGICNHQCVRGLIVRVVLARICGVWRASDWHRQMSARAPQSNQFRRMVC